MIGSLYYKFIAKNNVKNIKYENVDYSIRCFLVDLYKCILKRNIDENGLIFYEEILKSGESPLAVLKNIANSEESRQINDRFFLSKIKKILKNTYKSKSNIYVMKEISTKLKNIDGPNLENFLENVSVVSDAIKLDEIKLISNFFDLNFNAKNIPNFGGKQDQLAAMDLNLFESRKYIYSEFTKNWVKNYFFLLSLLGQGECDRVAPKLESYIVDKLSNISLLKKSKSFKNKIYIGVTASENSYFGSSVRWLLDQSIFKYADAGIVLVVNIPANVSVEKIIGFLKQYDAMHGEKNYILINRVGDLGRATNLVGTLMVAVENDAIICLADTDILYPEDHFLNLIKYFVWLEKKYAVGASGFNWKGMVKNILNQNFPNISYENIDGHLSSVDILKQHYGICLSRSWFSDDFLDKFFLMVPPETDMIKYNVFYSNYLEYKGIGRIVLNLISNNGHDYELGKYDKKTKIDIFEDKNNPSELEEDLFGTANFMIKSQEYIFSNFKTSKSSYKIAVATVCIGEAYTNDVFSGMQSKLQYCDRHGYDFVLSTKKLDDRLPLIWSKFILIQDLLKKGYDFVYYADADVVITNPLKKIERFFQKESGSILLTVDVNGLNAGNILVSNRPGARKILKMAMNLKEYHDHGPWYEQAALANIVRNNSKISLREVSICKKNDFNSYVNDWNQNDFCVHLAGICEKNNKLIMNTIYDISRCKVEVSEREILVLLPFFGDYSQDPNRKVNLLPKKRLKNDQIHNAKTS